MISYPQEKIEEVLEINHVYFDDEAFGEVVNIIITFLVLLKAL